MEVTGTSAAGCLVSALAKSAVYLGICYERIPRFGGGVYDPIVRRLELRMCFLI